MTSVVLLEHLNQWHLGSLFNKMVLLLMKIPSCCARNDPEEMSTMWFDRLWSSIGDAQLSPLEKTLEFSTRFPFQRGRTFHRIFPKPAEEAQGNRACQFTAAHPRLPLTVSVPLPHNNREIGIFCQASRSPPLELCPSVRVFPFRSEDGRGFAEARWTLELQHRPPL